MNDFSTDAELQAKALAIVDSVPDEEVELAVENRDPEASPAEGEGPAEEQVTHEQEEASDPSEVIEAPGSWKAEARELFEKLPSEIQQEVSRRDEEQKRTYNRLVNEATAAKQRAEAETTKVTEERRRYAAQVDFLAQQAQTYDPIMEEARKIDWDELAQKNPAEYVAKRNRLESHVARLQAITDEQQKLQHAQYQEVLRDQSQKLTEKLPEWRDEAKRKDLGVRLIGHMKDRGFDEKELANLVDHRLLLVAIDAMRYNEMVKNQRGVAAKKSAPAPRVQRPQAAVDRRTELSNRDKALKERALSSDREADKIAYIMGRI